MYPINKLQKDLLKDKKVVIHAIEQYHDGFILDLASEENEIQEETFLRLNKFNLGNDPINSLSDKLDTIFFPPPLELNEEDIVFAASNSTLNAMQGNEKWCDKCQETKSIEEFRDFNLISGIGRYCIDCKTN